MFVIDSVNPFKLHVVYLAYFAIELQHTIMELNNEKVIYHVNFINAKKIINHICQFQYISSTIAKRINFFVENIPWLWCVVTTRIKNNHIEGVGALDNTQLQASYRVTKGFAHQGYVLVPHVDLNL